MLTPTLSGTIMRRQHGARNILNGASRLGPACCCLIIEYVIHGDSVACTISTEEHTKEEEGEQEGGERDATTICQNIAG